MTPETPPDGFYILSVKYARSDMLTWWRANDSGYVWNLADAGVYTAEQVAANPGYYDNGTDTLAIPCADAWRASRRYVENCHANRRKLRGYATRARRRRGAATLPQHGLIGA